MEDRILACKKKAMSLLEYRDRTEWELRDKLAGVGFSEVEIEEAVAYVQGFHYIDDVRFAIHYVESHQDKKSIRQMWQELKQKHVAEETIEIAMEQISFDDSMALRREIQKRIKGKTVFSEKEKQKIAAGLYRKGFRTEDIFRELQEIGEQV